jgi:hypothetical protein
MSANNSFDGFTAGVLLSAAQNPSNHDSVYKLYKSLQNAGDAAPAPEIVSFIEAKIGMPCTIKLTSHKGIVKGVNMASCGFYPGSRYPVVVEITDSSMQEAIGEVFEYGLDQVEFEK